MAKKGRPRDVTIEHSILTAAYDLLLESGFEEVTIEKIAEKAGVSKVTIYKWWPNKAAVAADSFFKGAASRLPVPDTGSVKEDILIHAMNLLLYMAGKEGKVISELIGHGQGNSTLSEVFRQYYVKPRRAEAAGILRKGIERGELSAELDVDSSIDLLYGPIFYRLLVTGEPLAEDKVRPIVLAAFEGMKYLVGRA
ncbi:TetR/AcrR family transcriptional regulator [Paenibacillus shunpengii]|uniref:TetR/AcrR family transcriptional regulator n=1 Tax=Paenibacillus shunpengii TaxID=2054424 RepID=A0ABW5SH87_9BACL|nr:TetR/AcrR family transcriptional regulator [Paenibacillus sp. FSL H7-0326]OMC72133.1 TetR family transcriptional regulator [Paenibacillus sp. FSL H7-0326]